MLSGELSLPYDPITYSIILLKDLKCWSLYQKSNQMQMLILDCRILEFTLDWHRLQGIYDIQNDQNYCNQY
jgi:hypothetical protein